MEGQKIQEVKGIEITILMAVIDSIIVVIIYIYII